MIQATPTLQVNVGAGRMNDNVSYGAGLAGGQVTAATSFSSAAVSQTVPYSCTSVTAACVQNPIPGLAATYYNSTEATLAANWQATPVLKFNVGYISIVQSNPSNPLGDSLIDQNNGIPLYGNNTSPYQTNKTTTISWIGGTYDISPADHLKLAYYQYARSAYTGTTDAKTNGGTPGNPISSTQSYGQSSSTIFGFVYDHDLSKTTDVYLVGNMQKFDNGNQWTTLYTDGSSKNNGYAGQSITFFGGGLRVKF
jgi:predicted porin